MKDTVAVPDMNGAGGVRGGRVVELPEGSPQWEPPLSLGELTAARFPVDAFAPWLRDFINAEAIATQTPPDLAAMLALAILAVACTGRVRLRVSPGHEEPLNLFTVTVLAPGNRKSAVFSDVTAPVEAFEAEEALRMREPIASALQRRRILDARLKRAEEKAASAGDSETGKRSEEAARIRRERDETIVPAAPRLIADDCSPEKLASLLSEQGGRIGLLSAEGGVFDIMAGRYAKNGAANLDVYLKGHAGDSLRVDRVGRPAEYIQRPGLTIGLAIQPEVLEGLISRSEFHGRGLTARFLYAIPRSLVGHRDSDPPPMPDATREAYAAGIRRLLQLPTGTTVEGAPAPHILTLSEDARQAVLEFARRLEPRLAKYGDLALITEWASKLVGAACRIAGLLHMSDSVETPAPLEVPVSRAAVERAVRVADYLTNHALAAFGEMGADPCLEHARHLLGWIEHTRTTTFSARELLQAVKGRVKTMDEMRAALALLEEHRFVRLQAALTPSGPGRPPSPTYEVTPHLRRAKSSQSSELARTANSEDIENYFSGECPREFEAYDR
jgi:replicative DNA helicase